jgi:hypothetical protein
MHAPFTRKVECKIAPVRPVRVLDPPHATPSSQCCPPAEDRLLTPKLQMRIMQLARKRLRRCLRLLQAKLSRNSNQIARGRIRRFESYMPSQAGPSLRDISGQKISAIFPVSSIVARHSGYCSGIAKASSCDATEPPPSRSEPGRALARLPADSLNQNPPVPARLSGLRWSTSRSPLRRCK